MYLRGTQVTPQAGTTVLAHTVQPYFERSWRHFSSHRHTPSAGVVGAPAVTQAGRVIYFAHPVFTQYHTNAPRWVKQLVADAIARLLPMPLLRHQGPSTITSSVMRQSQRTIVHLLHYIPERRGLDFDVIEDVIPLYNVQIAIRADQSVGQMYLAPSMQELKYTHHAGYYHVTIPVIDGHAMLVCGDA
jgi:hypothetical protein